MAPAHLASCLFLFAGIAHSSDGTSLLQRGASRQRAFAGLRFSPKDPAARTLLALDTNHDGTIDPSEITAFALAQGLDSRTATQEFSSIDINEDGVLDSAELKQVLGAAPSTGLAAAPQGNLQATQASVTSAQEDIAVEAPLAAAPENLAEQSAVAIEAPLASAAAPTVEAPLAAAAVAPVVDAPFVAAAPADEPPLAGAASETIVAEAQLASVKAVSAPVAPVSAIESAELISDESRNSMRKAAQEVAEGLVLEENEEKEARSLDREAADVRAKSTAVAKQDAQDALEAGSAAAHSKATELMAKIEDLQDQAERAEVRAAALRAKAKIELEEGNQLMAVADQALKPEA